METTGQALTTTLRKSFRVAPRTLDRREGFSLKADMLESISNAVIYPGYYGKERTALSSAAYGVLMSFQKHYDGYRIDPSLRFNIETMSPYQFSALLGRMVDAGVTNVGQGEQFFANMARESRAAA